MAVCIISFHHDTASLCVNVLSCLSACLPTLCPRLSALSLSLKLVFFTRRVPTALAQLTQLSSPLGPRWTVPAAVSSANGDGRRAERSDGVLYASVLCLIQSHTHQTYVLHSRRKR